jgi:hypothetical protein
MWYGWAEEDMLVAKAVVCLAFNSSVWSADVVQVPGAGPGQGQQSRIGSAAEAEVVGSCPDSSGSRRVLWKAPSSPHLHCWVSLLHH